MAHAVTNGEGSSSGRKWSQNVIDASRRDATGQLAQDRANGGKKAKVIFLADP
jgi:hypothetical protein